LERERFADPQPCAPEQHDQRAEPMAVSAVVSREATVAFTEALERPAEVNDRLASAIRRKRTFSWLD